MTTNNGNLNNNFHPFQQLTVSINYSINFPAIAAAKKNKTELAYNTVPHLKFYSSN